MTREKISSAIGNISDRHVEEMACFVGKNRSRRWLGILSLAACFCIVFTLAVALFDRPFVDVYDDAYLSAEDVGKIFGVMDNKGTSFYTEVYRPQNRPLDLTPIPDSEYVDVYKINKLTKKLSKNELDALVDNIIPKLTAALGMSESSFQKYEFEDEEGLDVSYRRGGSTILDFSQESGEGKYGVGYSTNRVWVYNSYKPITLYGKTVQIDQRQSEEEILSSIEWVRDAFFEIFGQSFDSVKITFDYGDTHEYGAENIYVTYYNEADSIFVGDHITIRFDNYANSSGEPESADIITNCSVNYYTYRIDVEDYFSAEAKCRLISLQEAEKLLVKGYVFGGHSCPICMAGQKKVSFEDYDYVSFEYVNDTYSDEPRSVPFYVFYKDIGISENGNTIYAKTYVCAVELSGLSEYFESQKH